MRLHVSVIALSAALAACGGGGGGSGGTTTPVTSSNTAPTVSAGTDQTVTESATVQLDGSATDADGDMMTITWSQTSGTTVTLSSTSDEDPTFEAPDVASSEVLVFEISVTDGTATSTDTVSITVRDPSAFTNAPDWIINTTERSGFIDESNGSSQGALYDVQSAVEVTIDGVDYVEIQTQGIPQYDVEITQDILDDLNDRPRLTNDFSSGVTTATLGSTVAFGQDIGYNSNTENCSTTGGFGYWPPGPVCPTNQSRTEYIPVTPVDSTEDCETAVNTIGLFVNGAAVFGWGDTFSYNNEGVFFNLAAKNEVYDLDICSGHAAMGEYHLHNYSQCLADLVGDDGSDHSPIIGFAADGYPIYGPWEADGVLAISAWDARDYGASEADGGCNTPGERTCILDDEFDVTQGVTTVSSPGPDIGADVTSLSGNPLVAVDGFYYEDYVNSGRAATGAQLDEHNGHDNNDGRGYHYHVTLVEEGGELIPAFPFTLGPTLFGEVLDNGMASCGGAGAGPGGPGGPPP